MFNERDFSKRDIVNFYYIASKSASAALFLALIFIKDEYGGEGNFRYFLVFLTLAYLFINIIWLILRRNLFSTPWLRILDYAFGLLAILLATSAYGVLPAAVIVSIYATAFSKESFGVFLIYAIALFVNGVLLKRLSAEDFTLSLFFLITYYVVSTKFNITVLIKGEKKLLKNLKRDLQELNKTVALLSVEKKHYEEIISVIELISEKGFLDNLPEILKNLLKAEDVIIRRKNPFASPAREGYITVSLRDIVLMVKPKEKYLLGDTRYREKLKLLLKILRPYAESFLAKSR